MRFKRVNDLTYIYKNKLDKACFAHNAVYANKKDLVKRIVSDKVWKDRAYEIALNPKYNIYQRRLENMVYKFFDKKIVSGANVNEVLAQELQKPVIKKSRKKLLYKV